MRSLTAPVPTQLGQIKACVAWFAYLGGLPTALGDHTYFSAASQTAVTAMLLGTNDY
jgi:hypothetical protein